MGMLLEVKPDSHRVIFSKEKAALYGFLSADGLFKISERRYRIRFWNKDKQVIDYYCKIIKTVYGKEPSIYLKEKTQVFEVSVYGKEISYDLTKVFPAINSFMWTVPVEYLSEEGIMSWLRAYFEGDGGVDTAHYCEKIQAKSSNEEGIKQVGKALSNMGIDNKVLGPYTTKTGSVYFQLEIRSLSAWEIFRDKIGFISSKKNRQLEEIIDRGKRVV